ncbi:MAG: SurA N-terminal domain-containing protein [Candidatus Dojkabacteria bacterium]|nr:MAG: SurA N-terminal domain-containing protein [Candidatus Dojkabacteria bacterium]
MAEKSSRKSPARRARSRSSSSAAASKEKVEVAASKPKKATTKPDTAAKAGMSSVTSSVSNRFSKVNKRMVISIAGWTLLLVLSFVMIDYFVQYLNKGYSAGVIYGEGYTARVSKEEMYTRLEEQFGVKMTEKLLEEEIVNRAAKEKGVSVSDDEVDEVVEKAKEELGGEEAYLSALEAYSWTDAVFRQQTHYDLLKKKLLVEDPSDEELMAYFEQYKQVYFTEETSYEDVDKEQLNELYRNQKLSDSFNDWYEAELAKVTVKNNYAEDTDVSYGVLKTTRDILGSIWEEFQNRS